MTTQNRYYSNLAQGAYLNNPSGISNVETDVQVSSNVNWPTSFPFAVRIEPNTQSEEVMLITGGAGSAASPYVATRGYDGTVAKPHVAGVPIIPTVIQLDLAEPQQHINLTGSASGAHGLPSSAWNNTLVSKLQSQTLSVNTTTVTLPSIAQTCSLLRLYIQGIAATATVENAIQMTFNGDSGANYGQSLIYQASSTSLTSTHTGNSSWMTMGFAWGNSSTAIPGVSVIEIPGYSGSGLLKSAMCSFFSADTGVSAWAAGQHYGTWNNTAAITSISLNLASGVQWRAGSTFSLYGIL